MERGHTGNTYLDDIDYVTVLIDPDTGKLIDIVEFNYFYDFAPVGSNSITWARVYKWDNQAYREVKAMKMIAVGGNKYKGNVCKSSGWGRRFGGNGEKDRKSRADKGRVRFCFGLHFR